jgi:hypothetical protein
MQLALISMRPELTLYPVRQISPTPGVVGVVVDVDVVVVVGYPKIRFAEAASLCWS